MAIREAREAREAKATLAGLSREQLFDMHYKMVLLRRFEEKAAEEYTLGKIGGFLHLYIGQEASGVGTFSALQPDDYVLSAYREHGYAILKGLDPKAVMAELFGKATGGSKGKGGSMHMWSNEHHLLGGQAIVGGQLVMAAGLGIAIQYQNEKRIALALFGDGAVDEGAFHEALNLASVWKLPVVFLCENNQYSMGMAVTKAWAVPSLEPRAAGYGMPYLKVDGMDTLAVREAMLEARERAVSGGGPTLIESLTYRFRGHSMADPAYYRTREEEKLWKTTRDPIALFEDKLKEAGLMADRDISATNDRVDAEVAEYARFANESPDPTIDDLYADVTVDGRGAIAWRTKPSTPRE
ncbi:MAG: Pyruvate dehydrogenase E1 component alpha subunit [Ktedonobacterales bacterium]|jgi:pyruvate dehydrogenase E1 component alpha subunit|nr:MAG: Pyruvate dehydrogenase E1 component alpha subunit [Ktedonobacterales bacterium]